MAGQGAAGVVGSQVVQHGGVPHHQVHRARPGEGRRVLSEAHELQSRVTSSARGCKENGGKRWTAEEGKVHSPIKLLFLDP